MFGLDLEVASLPFQEQDTAVARCATSALWSVFQGTAPLFQHATLTPVEITRAATTSAAVRVLPNKGLTAYEVANAIKSCGLEPHVVSASDPDTLRRTAYAYLQAGIPSYLNFELIDINTEPSIVMNRHAVALTGFSTPNRTEAPRDDEIALFADRIDKLYVHDDQVGPFARMELDDSDTLWSEDGEEHRAVCWKTSWRGDSSEELYTANAHPLNLIVPVYHKIRVPFDAVLDVVDAFDAQLSEMREEAGQVIPNLEWDIFLSDVNQLKSDVRGAELPGAYRRAALEQPLPRFLWRAIGRVGSAPELELVFDATDIEQGSFMSRAVEYRQGLGALLRTVASEQLQWLPSDDLSRPIFRWFATAAGETG